MKKLLSIALCAAVVTAFGNPTETQLGGEIGVTAITSSLQNTIVAVSYDDLAGGSGMVVSNFVKTTNLTVDDQLAVFSDGKYEVWTLVQPLPPDGPKFWQKNETKFFVNGNGELTSESGMDASLVSRSVGAGIWLCRKEKPSEAFTFYIYGKPVSEPISTLVAGSWNLIGNPTQGEVTIGEKTVSGASDYDQLVIPVAPSGKLCYYTYLSGLKGWRKTNSEGTGYSTEDPKLEGGLGCWIKTKNKGSISWGSGN